MLLSSIRCNSVRGMLQFFGLSNFGTPIQTRYHIQYATFISINPFTGPKKLLVRNISKRCSKDGLVMCLERKKNFGRQLSVEETEVKLDSEKGEAIIWYKDDAGMYPSC